MSNRKRRTLSKPQNIRLAGLITVLSGREPYDWILAPLVQEGFVIRLDGALWLTKSGIEEKDRLAAMAGLIVNKDDARAVHTLFDDFHYEKRLPLTKRMYVNPTD